MILMGAFLFAIAAIVAVFLSREGVTAAPWLEDGEIATFSRGARPPATTGRVGLYVFLAVAACLFFLMASAFLMRMDSDDWRAPALPKILWLNTAALLASCVFLQSAAGCAARREIAQAKLGLQLAALGAVLFLCGQIWAWRDMISAGLFAAGDAASAFFSICSQARTRCISSAGWRRWRSLRGWRRRASRPPASRRASNPARSIGIFCCSYGWRCSRCFPAAQAASAPCAAGC